MIKPLRRNAPVVVCRGVPFLPMPTSFPVDTPPDAVLITHFQAGESGVFDLLYRRHRDRIHGVVLHIVSNPEDALDITQDVFLKAYQSLYSFKKAS